MKYLLFIGFLLYLPNLAIAQIETFSQVSIPVYFSELDPSQQKSSIRPIGELSGIAVLFFENQDTFDNIQFSRKGDPLVWFEKVGVSSKATLIFPGKQIHKMEMLLSNETLAITFWENERKFAKGTIVNEGGRYTMRLTGNPMDERIVLTTIGKANHFLMRLHLRPQKKIVIRPGFNLDTLNVIMGADSQFDTNFEIIWLQQALYNRIFNAATFAHEEMVSSSTSSFSQKVENNALVEHTAKLSDTDNSVVYGSVVVLFEVMGDNNYFFLKAGERYQIAVDYYFEYNVERPKISLETIMLRNVSSGDFMEMEIVDLVSEGLPVIYVDLINSVIMEDYGTWNIIQVFTVLEDIFGIVEMPHEGG